MEMAHRLDQPGVLDGERRMRGVFLEESPAQQAAHERKAARIQPDPLKGEAFRMGYWQDVEGEIDPMHQPGPDANGGHVGEDALHIDPQQTQERNEKVTEDNNDTDPKPGALLANHIPESFFRHIAVPNDEVLGEMDVSVKHRECEKERPNEIV